VRISQNLIVQIPISTLLLMSFPIISHFCLIVLNQRVPNLIAGKFVESKSLTFIDVINPVSGFLFYYWAYSWISCLRFWERNASNVDIVWYNRQHKKLFHKFLWLQMKNLKLQWLQQRRHIHHGVTLQSRNANVLCWSSRSLFAEIWLAPDTMWQKFYFF
jgi:hypothetical protein